MLDLHIEDIIMYKIDSYEVQILVKDTDNKQIYDSVCRGSCRILFWRHLDLLIIKLG